MAKKAMWMTDNYAQRAYVRRVYLDRLSTTPEKIQLLAGLLNRGLRIEAKKPLASLAGATLSFATYSYGDGYVLEERMTQQEANGFSYLFTNPYQKALTLFRDVFESGFVPNEKTFALVKEDLISHEEALLADSLKASLSMLEVPYSFPEISFPLVRSMTLDDELVTLKDIRRSTRGDLLYLGKEQHKDPFRSFALCNQELSSLPQNYDVAAKDLYSPLFKNDVRSFVLAMAPLKSLSDYQTLQATLLALDALLKDRMMSNYSVAVTLTYQVISPIKVLVQVSAQKGLLAQADRFLLSFFTPPYGDIGETLEKGADLVRLDALDLAGSFPLAIDRLRTMADFALSYDPNAFLVPAKVTKEAMLSLSQSLRVIFVLKATYDKGEKK